MKWLTYRHPQTSEERAGFLSQHYIIDLKFSLTLVLDQRISRNQAPTKLLDYIEQEEQWRHLVQAASEMLSKWDEDDWKKQRAKHEGYIFLFGEVSLLSPLPKPSSVRDCYAFEQHVKTARGKRGLDMIAEWYHFPVFYFSNHQAICGPEDSVVFPTTSKKWDFELEVGIVMGKKGRNIPREGAFQHIFGLTILNDWSARDIQANEVKVGLGPAKAKDFATSLGPFIVTPEEWSDRKQGDHIDLKMEAMVNGRTISKGNLNQLYWSIPHIIERLSQDCTLFPGDVIGTGTVGTGCLLEHNDPIWLQSNDIVQLRVERLGVLRNVVR
jgi:fumarylacetoacetate (FAA) hydrolase